MGEYIRFYEVSGKTLGCTSLITQGPGLSFPNWSAVWCSTWASTLPTVHVPSISLSCLLGIPPLPCTLLLLCCPSYAARKALNSSRQLMWSFCSSLDQGPPVLTPWQNPVRKASVSRKRSSGWSTAEYPSSLCPTSTGWYCSLACWSSPCNCR